MTQAPKLYVQIALEIRGQIETGRLLPGDRLPPLKMLADDFGCSRATIREALAALRGQGLVEFRHGDGTYVRTAAIETWMEPLEAAILMGQSQIEALVSLLSAALLSLVTYAARHHLETDVDGLRQALFRRECAIPSGEETVTAELAFFMELADAVGNSLFQNTLRVLQEALRSSLRLLQTDEPLGLYTCRAVFDAVASGDVEAAKTAVLEYGDRMIGKVIRVRAQ